MAGKADSIGGISVDIEANLGAFNSAMEAAEKRLDEFQGRQVTVKFKGITEAEVARMERAAKAMDRIHGGGGGTGGGPAMSGAAREGAAAAREGGSTTAAKGSIELELKGGGAALRGLIEEALAKPFQITIEIENLQAIRQQLEGLTGSVRFEATAGQAGAFSSQPVGGANPFKASADLAKALGGDASDNVQMLFEGVNDALKQLGESTLGMADDSAEMLHRMASRFGNTVEQMVGLGARGAGEVGGATGDLINRLNSITGEHAAQAKKVAQFLNISSLGARGALGGALPAYRAQGVFTAPAHGPAQAPPGMHPTGNVFTGPPPGSAGEAAQAKIHEQPVGGSAEAEAAAIHRLVRPEARYGPKGIGREAYVPKPVELDDIIGGYGLTRRTQATPQQTRRAGAAGLREQAALQADRSRAGARRGRTFNDMLSQIGIDPAGLGKGDAATRAVAEILGIPMDNEIWNNQTDKERRAHIMAQLRPMARNFRHLEGMTSDIDQMPKTQTGVYGPSKVLPRAGKQDIGLKVGIPDDVRQVDSAGRAIMAPAGWVDPLSPEQRARVNERNAQGTPRAFYNTSSFGAIGNSGGPGGIREPMEGRMGPHMVPGDIPTDTDTTFREREVSGKEGRNRRVGRPSYQGIDLLDLAVAIKNGKFQGYAAQMENGKETGKYVQQRAYDVIDELESLTGPGDVTRAGTFAINPNGFGTMPGHTGQFKGVQPAELIQRALVGMGVPEAAARELTGANGLLQPFMQAGAANINRNPETLRGGESQGGAFAPNSASSLRNAARDELERRALLRSMDTPGIDEHFRDQIMAMDQKQRDAAYAADVQNGLENQQRVDESQDTDQTSVRNQTRRRKSIAQTLERNTQIFSGGEVETLSQQVNKLVGIWDRVLAGDLPETSLADDQREALIAQENDPTLTPSQRADARKERLDAAMTSRQGIRSLINEILPPIYTAMGIDKRNPSTKDLSALGLDVIPAAVAALYGNQQNMFGAGSPGAGPGRGWSGAKDEGLGFVKPGFATAEAEAAAAAQDARAGGVRARDVIKPKISPADQRIRDIESELMSLQGQGVNKYYAQPGGKPIGEDIVAMGATLEGRTREERAATAGDQSTSGMTAGTIRQTTLARRNQADLMARRDAELTKLRQEEPSRQRTARERALKNKYNTLIDQSLENRRFQGIFEEIDSTGAATGKFQTGREVHARERAIKKLQEERQIATQTRDWAIQFGSDPKWRGASVDEVIAAAPPRIHDELRARLTGPDAREPGHPLGEAIVKGTATDLRTGDQMRRDMANAGMTPPGEIPPEETKPTLKGIFAEDRAAMAAMGRPGEVPGAGAGAPPEGGPPPAPGGATPQGGAGVINVRIVGASATVPVSVRGTVRTSGGGGPGGGGGAGRSEPKERNAALRADLATGRGDGTAFKWAKKYKEEGWSESEIRSVLGEHYGPGVAGKAVRNAFEEPVAPVAPAAAPGMPKIQMMRQPRSVVTPQQRARTAQQNMYEGLFGEGGKADTGFARAEREAQAESDAQQAGFARAEKQAQAEFETYATREAQFGKAEQAAADETEASANQEAVLAQRNATRERRQQVAFSRDIKRKSAFAERMAAAKARGTPTGAAGGPVPGRSGRVSNNKLMAAMMGAGMSQEDAQNLVAGPDLGDEFDPTRDENQNPLVLEARARVKQATASLPSRAPSTMMVQLAQRLFGGRGGENGTDARLMRLQTEAGDLNKLQLRQTGFERNLAGADQLRGRLGAELVTRRTTGQEVPSELADAFEDATKQVEVHTKHVEENGKALAAQADKVRNMEAATPTDVIRNLATGFVGGIGGALITGAISQIAGTVVQVLDTMQPMIDDMTGGFQRANRTNAGVAQQISGGGFKPEIEAMLFAQAGLTGEGMGGLSVAARGIAGNQQLRQRADLNQANFVAQQQQQRLGLPAWAAPSLVQAQGGMFSFNGIGGPLASLFGSRAIGGEASTDETAAGILMNGAASARDRQPGNMMDPLGQLLADPGGVIGSTLAGVIPGAIGGAVVGAPALGVGAIPGAILGGIAGGVGGYTVGRMNANNADPEELKRLYANVGSINDMLDTSSEGRFAVRDPEKDAAAIEATAKAFEDAKFQDMANTVRTLGLSFEGADLSAESLTKVMADLAKGGVSLEGTLNAMAERAIPNMIKQIDFESGMAMRGMQSGMAIQGISAPLMPFGTGVPGGTRGLNMGGTRNLDRRVGAMNRENRAVLNDQLGELNPVDHAAAQQAIDDLEEISNLQMRFQKQAANIQAATAWEEYNHQLHLAKRNVADLAGLVGKSNGSEMGQMERKNLLAQRELQVLQQTMAQRQLNFQRALAGFMYEGATPEEAADRRRIAEIQARDAQKGLNLEKGIGNRAFDIVNKQNIRQYQDAVKETTLLVRRMESERMVQILSQKIERTARLQAQFEGQIGVFLNKAQSLEKAGFELAASVAENIGGLIEDTYDAARTKLREEAKSVKKLIDELNAKPDPYADAKETASKHSGEHLSGEGGNWVRATGMGTGEGGQTINFDFSGAQVRSDEDIDQIVRKVERALNRKAGLFGLTRQPIS